MSHFLWDCPIAYTIYIDHDNNQDQMAMAVSNLWPSLWFCQQMVIPTITICMTTTPNSACRDCPDVLNIDDACAPVPR